MRCTKIIYACYKKVDTRFLVDSLLWRRNQKPVSAGISKSGLQRYINSRRNVPPDAFAGFIYRAENFILNHQTN